MANIMIITTGETICVCFNDLSSTVGYERGCWRKDNILNILEHSDKIEINMRDGSAWFLSYDGVETTFQIDTIDRASLTSNADLYDKLFTMMG